MLKEKSKNRDAYAASVTAQNKLQEGNVSAGIYEVECIRNGEVLWTERFSNLVVNEGLNHILDIVLAAGTQVTAWFLGLKGSGAIAAGDTLASKAWSEVTAYSEANRQAFTPGAVSGQSVDNDASRAEYSINDTVTVNGAFLASNNTKSGTTGVLYSVGDFAVPRDLQNGDTLRLKYTATQSAA